MDRSGLRFNRRQFVRLATGSITAAALGSLPGLSGCGEKAAGPDGTDPSSLPVPGVLGIGSVTLTAAPARSSSISTWRYNDHLPGPTLIARQGDQATIRLANRLSEPTIIHWHGLIVPGAADGHPRHVIGSGGQFDYAFPIVQRAGTYWYHPHPHQRTAAQVQAGLAGFFLISDHEEAALDLPAGGREILLVLQDRDANPSSAFDYHPTSMDLQEGMLRDVAWGNGVRSPTLTVVGGLYRLRVLNASHARVYRLAVSTGAPLTVIGNDGGLLPAAVEVGDVYLGVGERADILLDFSGMPPGTSMMLQSLPFSTGAPTSATFPQGRGMDLLEIRRDPTPSEPPSPMPGALSAVAPLGAPAVDRTFVFGTTAGTGMHRINGLTFDMDRVDVQVPLGRTERWIFVNDSTIPHPVHLHGTQFQVESRGGGRGIVYPYEAGWKDTALIFPGETVAVRVRFTTYAGLFLLHCHNLQHEDDGMMLNVQVG